MSPRTHRPARPSPSAPDITAVTPERQREGAELLDAMRALDHAGDTPEVVSKRAVLREQAKAIGLQIKSFTISVEPLPDPVIDALPAAQRRALNAVHQAMYAHPAAQVAKLRSLIAKHPRIPVLRNQLAMALNHAGEDDEAERVLAACVKEFPTYLFAFCNYIMWLVRADRIAEARSLMENSPRGPLFNFCDFDPTREVFHISEAVSYACAVGHYLLATSRIEAAKVQLRMLIDLKPDSPQARSLAAVMPEAHKLAVLRGAINRLVDEEKARRAAKPKRSKAAKQTAQLTPASRRATPDAHVEHEPKPAANERASRGLFDKP